MGKKLLKVFIGILVFALMPVVNASVTEFDETLNTKGEYDSTRIIFANNVNNSSKVNGISLVFGNQVTSQGSSEYQGVAGNIVNISDDVENDLFVLGNMITVLDTAKINRDMFVAGNSVTIKSDINRNLYAGCATLDLRGITIEGDAIVEADTIKLDKNTVIKGKLTTYEDAEIIGKDEANIKEIKILEVKDVEVSEPTLMSKVTDFISKLATRYICLILILIVFKGVKKHLDDVKLNGEYVVKTSAIGLATLIIVPIVSIISMITVVLLPLSLMTLCIYIYLLYI